MSAEKDAAIRAAPDSTPPELRAFMERLITEREENAVLRQHQNAQA